MCLPEVRKTAVHHNFHLLVDEKNSELLSSRGKNEPLYQARNRLIEAESRWTRAQVTHALGEIDAPLDDARRAATIFQQLNAPLELNTIATWLSARGHSLS